MGNILKLYFLIINRAKYTNDILPLDDRILIGIAATETAKK